MPTIPEVRTELTDIATAMRKSSDVDMIFLADRLDQCIRDLYRRGAKRVAPVKAPAMTDTIRASIRCVAFEFPNMSQLEIGREVGRRLGIREINPGRVSETLRGKRR